MERDIRILNEGLEEIITGYNGKQYSLQSLKNTANKYKSSGPNIEETKNNHAKVYNCKTEIVSPEILKQVYNLDNDFKEIWESVPLNTKVPYCVSNLGRIAIKLGDNKREILEQEDIIGRHGYLIISYNNPKEYGSLNHSECIYNLIASAFLGKTQCDGKQVHHINNNGYDCRPDNLILLMPREHSKVHGFFVSGDKE